jgi:uncharacterized FlaG/YvyC family protein
MEIAPVNRNLEAAPVIAGTLEPEKLAESREVIQAVKAVNAAGMLGEGKELLFQLDRLTHRLVVRLVNRDTGDVEAQIPEEYVLRMAEELLKEH